MISKQYFLLLIATFLSSTSQIIADDRDGFVDFTDQSSEIIQSKTKESAYTAKSKIDVVRKSRIKEGFYKGDEIEFAEGNIELGRIFYYNDKYKEGISAAINYSSTYIHWANNPWLEQDRFYTGSFTVSAFSHRLSRWFWRSQAAINVNTQEWNFSNYANYDLLLWGRYEYCKHIGFHVGLIVETGMQMDRIYPILGIDWQISKKWKLNMVFPLNVSLDYTINKSWSIALAGRTFNTRLRANQSEGQSKALVRYQNVGAEFAIKYEKDSLSANIHAGSTLGGQLRIADRNNHHPHHYRMNPSGYAGGEIDLKF